MILSDEKTMSLKKFFSLLIGETWRIRCERAAISLDLNVFRDASKALMRKKGFLSFKKNIFFPCTES